MKKRKKLNAVDENKRFEFQKGFYSRFVTNLVDIRNVKDELTFKGDSPFADGDIIIDNTGNWHCESTGETGDFEDFLMKENPLLTDRGANAAILDEAAGTVDWHGIKILDNRLFRKELKSFRKFVDNDKTFPPDQKAKFLTNNYWINEAGDFHYMELSRTDQPLCRYHWGHSEAAFGLFFLTCGVSRIKEHPDAKRIYFVENPLQLIILKEIVNDPIYVKPDEFTYEHNDYPKMVKGKEIVFCSSKSLFYYAYEDLDFERFDGNDTDAVISLLKRPRKY